MSKNEERYLLQALDFEDALRAYLHRYTGDESAAEDLLQETYARLLTAGAADAPEVCSIRAFSLGIARDVAGKWLREGSGRRSRLDPRLEAVEDGEQTDPVEEIVKRREELARLLGAIQELPEQHRQVFTLRKVYGHAPAQIASRLGIDEQVINECLTLAARRCAQVVFRPAQRPRRAGLLERLRFRMGAHEPGR